MRIWGKFQASCCNGSNPQDGKRAMDIAVEKGSNEIIEVLRNYQSKVRFILHYQAKSCIMYSKILYIGEQLE